ncbi:hypothetical protein GWI33_019106 [Rhynchophorus ferrugineus]|uniref:Uncharacterized protein n=1 Tax=Rhynchophorus ferrugineus TaxID=354439 RepID=A0A834M1L9_RHYFE|nr:hypothetical protein GWI33_019106 [Rhynchophorus ferrugineus]
MILRLYQAPSECVYFTRPLRGFINRRIQMWGVTKGWSGVVRDERGGEGGEGRYGERRREPGTRIWNRSAEKLAAVRALIEIKVGTHMWLRAAEGRCSFTSCRFKRTRVVYEN